MFSFLFDRTNARQDAIIPELMAVYPLISLAIGQASGKITGEGILIS